MTSFKVKSLEGISIIIMLISFLLFSQTRLPIFLGFMSSIAMAMTFELLPLWLKKIVCSFRIIIDIGLAFIIPLWFGNFTATALIGSAVNSIFVSIYLAEEAKKLDNKHAYSKIRATKAHKA